MKLEEDPTYNGDISKGELACTVRMQGKSKTSSFPVHSVSNPVNTLKLGQ